MRPLRASFRRLGIGLGAVSVALSLGACGQQSHPTTVGANNDGTYVDAGEVTYQLEVSRALNPYDAEDSQYVRGLPPGTPAAKPDEFWYGVFIWAKNFSNSNQTTSDSFDILDTQGNKYYPVKLNPSINAYAWTAMTLRPSQTEPGLDTTASFGPTQGGLLLFKLSTSVYSNRPLTLEIYGPGQSKPSSVSLDL